MLTLMTIFWQLKLPWLSTLLAAAGKRVLYQVALLC